MRSLHCHIHSPIFSTANNLAVYFARWIIENCIIPVVVFKTSIFNFAWISGINHALIKYMKTVLLDPLNMANAKTYDTKTAKLWSKATTKKNNGKLGTASIQLHTCCFSFSIFFTGFFSDFQSSVQRNEFFMKTNNWIWTIFFSIHTVSITE